MLHDQYLCLLFLILKLPLIAVNHHNAKCSETKDFGYFIVDFTNNY